MSKNQIPEVLQMLYGMLCSCCSQCFELQRKNTAYILETVGGSFSLLLAVQDHHRLLIATLNESNVCADLTLSIVTQGQQVNTPCRPVIAMVRGRGDCTPSRISMRQFVE